MVERDRSGRIARKADVFAMHQRQMARLRGSDRFGVVNRPEAGDPARGEHGSDSRSETVEQTAETPADTGTVKPTIGRTVHFVLDQGPSIGEHRPAVVVRTFDMGGKPGCNLQVILDTNEDGYGNDSPAQWSPPVTGPVFWATSREYDAEKAPGTWHWPERE